MTTTTGIVFILFATFEMKWHARHLAISTFKASAVAAEKGNDKWTEKSSFYFAQTIGIFEFLNGHKRAKSKGFGCLSFLQHDKGQ